LNKSANLGLLVAAFLTFVLLGASDALAQARAGSVTSLTGDVHVERAGTTVPEPSQRRNR